MEKPPDSGGFFHPPILFDKDKTLKLTTPGPKYLVMTRKNSSDSLSKVSPFLIKKVIDSVCGGEVTTCNKLRNGTIIIQTKNIIQASKLIKLASLSPDIQVEVSEHNSLNYSKGVIYSNDLRSIPEDIIQEELKPQNVGKVEKIMKKNTEGNLEETGLIILTFNSTSLPSEVAIGYERVRIRTYIPLPLRCKTCLRYGHIAKVCQNVKLCPYCSQEFHLGESEELCTLNKNCINCKEENLDFNHSSIDKKCPIFLKEKEIQAIITQEKVSKKKATNIYNQRHINTFTTYSSIVKNQSTNHTIKQTPDDKNKPANHPDHIATVNTTQRSIQDYSSIISDVDISDNEITGMDTQSATSLSEIENTATKSSTGNNTFLLPKNTSKKTKSKIKKKILSGNKKK